MYNRKSLHLGLLAACTLGLVFAASSANAQDTGGSDDNTYQSGSVERILVTPPNYEGPSRGLLGGPIVDVSTSKSVYYSDLDLRTDEGMLALHSRVRIAARQLCNKLDVLYPSTTADSPPCFSDAVARAMPAADAAIVAARRYASR